MKTRYSLSYLIFLRHFVPKYMLKKYLKQFSIKKFDIIQNVLITSSSKIFQGAKYPNTLILYITYVFYTLLLETIPTLFC